MSPPPPKSKNITSEPTVAHQKPLKLMSPVEQVSSEKPVRSEPKVSQRKIHNSPSPVSQSRSDDVSSKPKISQRNFSNSPSPARPASGSSNSSNESNQKPTRPLPQVRSETRTMNHSDRKLPKPVVSPDTEEVHKGQYLLLYLILKHIVYIFPRL